MEEKLEVKTPEESSPDKKGMFLSDPSSQQQSVSLTILIAATLLFIVAICLNMTGVVDRTSDAGEFFGMAAGLYFLRRSDSLLSVLTNKRK